MAYMIYQRYTTAVKNAYAGRPEATTEHARAFECRTWLQSLTIEPSMRDELVEQVRAVEEGLRLAALDAKTETAK